ncbi:hypothetical protein WKH57_15230 [Niallia taxi]|uniref:hypothetical protein n=1 Tax=Niallia taxi TaxID=2499688 RepID=UPI0031764611
MSFLYKADQAANLEGKLLRLDLQAHAEDITPPSEPTPPAEPPTPPTEPEPPAKTFTQDDVNSVAAKEAKKAQEKLLKQLGITDFENAKEGMQKFQQWQESQKTEEQKRQEQFQALENNFKSAQEAKSNLETQVAVLSAGVKKDFAQDVAALAKNYVTEEIDINKAVEMVVEKYPHFLGQQEPETPPKPTFGQEQYRKSEQTELDQWVNAFKN